MLHLRPGDIILGLNGQPAATHPDFERNLKETLRNGSAILHIRRAGVEFRVRAERPLLAEFDETVAGTEDNLLEGLQQITLPGISGLEDYEIFKHNNGRAHSLPLKPSVAAAVAPPFWLISMRSWDAAAATVAALATAIAVHWMLAVLCYLCISIYCSRNQKTLSRHLLARQGFKSLLFLAEPNETEAQRRARELDSSLQFVYAAPEPSSTSPSQG